MRCYLLLFFATIALLMPREGKVGCRHYCATTTELRRRRWDLMS
jgi:hypothetical protein